MESVDGEEPPPELILAWQCERWGCLPEIGGYLNQDYRTMRLMTSLSNVYYAISKLRNLRGEKIHTLTENDRKILKYLVDMGLIFNG